MRGEITLNNPIMIDGKSTATLSYDANEITAELFMDAETQMLKRRTRGGTAAVDAKLDYGFQLCLGCAAVIAVNDGLTFEDLMRVKGFDISELRQVGQNFILGRSEESSEATGSDGLSETTPASSPPPPQTSGDSD